MVLFPPYERGGLASHMLSFNKTPLRNERNIGSLLSKDRRDLAIYYPKCAICHFAGEIFSILLYNS